MRPLDKGNCPQLNGTDKIVTQYSDWRGDLIDRIGYYCAYCNIPLSHSLNVEHVIPKNPPSGHIPGAALAWSNMLLACGPCNNAKDNQPINSNDYYLPEEHNTLLPFEIVAHPISADAAIVQTKTTISNQIQIDKSNRTITLLDLANIDRRNNIVDIRWKKRKKAMIAVEAELYLYNEAKNSPTYDPIRAAECVAIKAGEIGFFSIWFKAFSNDPLVMQKLLDSNIIPGTAQNCFQPSTYNPIDRNPHNTTDPF